MTFSAKAQLATLLGLLALCPIAQAQPLVLDSLTISSIPEGWSRQSQPGNITLSNYNQLNAATTSLIFYRGRPTSPKPDADFAQAWRQVWGLPDTAAVPRMRRLSTEEGIALYANVFDSRAPKNAPYRGLYLYWKAGFCIAVKVEAASLADWKQQQYNWEPILQAAKWRRK